jgi:hypothetical protein
VLEIVGVAAACVEVAPDVELVLVEPVEVVGAACVEVAPDVEVVLVPVDVDPDEVELLVDAMISAGLAPANEAPKMKSATQAPMIATRRFRPLPRRQPPIRFRFQPAIAAVPFPHPSILPNCPRKAISNHPNGGQSRAGA